MALRVVSSDLTDRNGTVIVAGDSQEEVMSAAGRQLAITTASSRFARAGVSGNEVAYPVDEQGQSDEDLILGRSGRRVAGYHCEYKVTAGL